MGTLYELGRFCPEDMFILLVGNKADLTKQREVPACEGRAFYDYPAPPVFVETSAKTGHNVDVAFLTVAQYLMSHKLGEREPHRFFGARQRNHCLDR